MILLSLIFSIYSVYAQVCLTKNQTLDESCGCGKNCYQFYSETEKQVIKKSKIPPKQMQFILNNQKETAKAFNKLMRNETITENDLKGVRKETQVLTQYNKAKLADLNKKLAKKGKKIDLVKGTAEYNKKFMSGFSPETRKRLMNPSPTFRSLAASGMKFEATPEKVQELEQEISKTNSVVSDLQSGGQIIETEEELVQGQVKEFQKKKFIYENDINLQKMDSIFTQISAGYQRVYDQAKLKPYHFDTEEDLQTKKKIREDIREILQKYQDN